MSDEASWPAARAAGFHYWRTGGDRPPLLLAHGYGDNGLCWARVAEVLAADFDVVMVDARGHGESVRAHDRFSPATDLALVIEALSLEAPVVVGHSVGASAAASLAAAAPHSVSRLVLEDPPWSPPLDDEATRARGADYRRRMRDVAAMSAAQLLELGRSLHPQWSAEEFPHWGRSKQQLQPDLFSNLDLQDFHDSVPAIRCPTLVVHGQADLGSMLREETIAELAGLAPAFEVQCIEGAGHNVRREQFPRFMEVVGAFVKR